MYTYLMFLSLLVTALAGPQTCHHSFVNWDTCSTINIHSCVEPCSTGTCQNFPSLIVLEI